MWTHIATDYVGLELEEYIAGKLRGGGHEVIDHGAHSYDPMDDYPPMCIACGEAVVADPGSLGIVIGGSGNGEQIAASKVRGVRVALAWNLETARFGREHSDTDAIAIGARQHGHGEALPLVELFIGMSLSGDERYQRRIDLVAWYESSERWRVSESAGSPQIQITGST